MTNLDVTYADLIAASTALQGFAEEITAIFTDAQSAVDGLIGSGFQSASASAEYDSQFSGFSTSSLNAAKALENMSSFLRTAPTAYSSTDSGLAKGLEG